MTKKSVIGLLFLALIIFLAESIGQNYDDEYDVPFVPTRYEIVDQMLEIADVGGDDILYDLGCGDGRIVITAAKKFGTHGIGIDINPIRIGESKENAINEGVTDKVRFIELDLFMADISEATVVSLYLLPSVNLKLRPKLFHELKPGTRIVSHDFDMGEWEPDQSLGENDNNFDFDNHTVYFWILPANVSGTWELEMSARTDKKVYSMHLDQKFQDVDGNLTFGGSSVPISIITIKGDKLQFTIEEKIGDQNIARMFKGQVKDNLIEGTVVSKARTTSDETSWIAKRDPSTIIPLDVADSDSQ
ncbi:class I SAM-dependent methyltransferase [Candidatus Latescibacterota bacterium]